VSSQQSALDWLPAELVPVALRLARADELEYQLGWECLYWSLHALEMKQVRRANGLIDVVVERVRPIPPLISMLFSEVINHLRAAIDNVVFHIVESLRGAPLPSDAASLVAMPIQQSGAGLSAWSNRRKRAVPELDTGTDLYDRIEKLQPYKSPAVATAISADFERFVGKMNLHGVHPLTLLQRYSNDDKHRAIRLAAARTITSGQGPGQYNITAEPVDAGFVIADGRDGTPREIDPRSVVHVQRPGSTIWVAPGMELAQIHTYVADVVIPTLLTGAPASPSLPRQLRLDDSGETVDERIRAGGGEPADKRVGEEAWIKAQELERDPPQRLPPP